VASEDFGNFNIINFAGRNVLLKTANSHSNSILYLTSHSATSIFGEWTLFALMEIFCPRNSLCLMHRTAAFAMAMVFLKQ
jgi:hypothetical protein